MISSFFYHLNISRIILDSNINFSSGTSLINLEIFYLIRVDINVEYTLYLFFSEKMRAHPNYSLPALFVIHLL